MRSMGSSLSNTGVVGFSFRRSAHTVTSAEMFTAFKDKQADSVVLSCRCAMRQQNVKETFCQFSQPFHIATIIFRPLTDDNEHVNI